MNWGSKHLEVGRVYVYHGLSWDWLFLVVQDLDFKVMTLALTDYMPSYPAGRLVEIWDHSTISLYAEPLD